MKNPEPTHLEYLLTAYLFDSLSPAGRREVEEHLAACAACRAEMEELRGTLQAVQGVLGPGAAGAETYSFEERRRQRVLAARGSEGRLNAIGLPRLPWKWIGISLGSAAAIILALVWINIPTMSTRGRIPGSSNAAPQLADGRSAEGDYSPYYQSGDMNKPRYLHTDSLALNAGATSAPVAAAKEEMPLAIVAALPAAPATPPPAAEPPPAPAASAGLAVIPAPAAPKAPALEVAARTEIFKGLPGGGGGGGAGPYRNRIDDTRVLKVRSGSEEAQAAGGQPAGPGNAPAQAAADPGAVPEGTRFAFGSVVVAPSEVPEVAVETRRSEGEPMFERRSNPVEQDLAVRKLSNEVLSKNRENSRVEDRAKLAKEAKADDGISASTAAGAPAPAKPAQKQVPSPLIIAKVRPTTGSTEITEVTLAPDKENLDLPDQAVGDLADESGKAKAGGAGVPAAVEAKQLSAETTELPDGYHQSTFTASTRGGKPVRLAARDRIGTSLRNGKAAAGDDPFFVSGGLPLLGGAGGAGGGATPKAASDYAKLKELAGGQPVESPKQAAPSDKNALPFLRGNTSSHDDMPGIPNPDSTKSQNGQLGEETRKGLVAHSGVLGDDPANDVNALKSAAPGKDFDAFSVQDASRNKVWDLNGDGAALWGDSTDLGFRAWYKATETGQRGEGEPGLFNFGNTVLDNADSGIQGWSLSVTAPSQAGQDRYAGRVQHVPDQYTGRLIQPSPERVLRAYRYWKETDPSLTLEKFAFRLQPIPRPEIGDEGLGQEGFRKRYGVNPFVDTRRDHLSTFGMDVSTASFTLARNTLRSGRLPDPPAIRVEEFVNYFREELKADPEQVFSVASEGGPSPFREGVELLKITVKARELLEGERKPAVLTFLVDTSGSMASGTASASLSNMAPEAPPSGDEARISMVRKALHTLVDSLGPDDRIGIAGFSGQAYLVLSHTPARERERILSAIDSLSPRGATNVEAGLDLAYRLADEVFQPRAVNRVILLSDGVANVGERGPDEILKKVQVFAQRGIYLSSIGVGMGRYNDRLLEALATRGNGNYAYVDSEEEAVRIFRECLPSTLQVLAQDAKVQVDFNPEVVDLYRLLGYEKRNIADQDFRNDKIDAGEVGPGTTVTVLYEVRRRTSSSGDLGRIRLRYLDTGTGRVQETDYPLSPGVLATGLEATSPRFRLIAAAAQCAELLRGSHWSQGGSFGTVLALLGTIGAPERDRPEWKDLVEIASRAQALTVESLAAGK